MRDRECGNMNYLILAGRSRPVSCILCFMLLSGLSSIETPPDKAGAARDSEGAPAVVLQTY